MLQQISPVTVHIEAGVLNDALKRVRPAISKEETRYYLCGVYMHAYEGKIRFVAIDGPRLSMVDAATFDDTAAPAFPSVILPTTFVAAVIKATNKTSRAFHDCPLVVLPGKVTAHPHNEKEIECAPIDGTFPDYLCVLPREEKPECGIHIFKRDELLNAVAALTAFKEAVEDCPPVLLFSFENDKLKISAAIDWIYGNGAWEGNGAHVTLKLADPISAPRQVGFNGRYLVDLLKTMGEQQAVAFHFYDPSMPALFKAENSGQWVVMPCRV